MLSFFFLIIIFSNDKIFLKFQLLITFLHFTFYCELLEKFWNKLKNKTEANMGDSNWIIGIFLFC